MVDDLHSFDKNKIRAAEALFPLLDAFHSIEGEPLQSVWQQVELGCIAQMVLEFETRRLVVAANPDDDSVAFWTTNGPHVVRTEDETVVHLEPWKSLIGKRFGWGWVTVNQQGYCDGVLLSFVDIDPRVILNVIASSIKWGTIEINEHRTSDSYPP